MVDKNNNFKDLFYLLSCSLNGKKANITRVSNMNLDKILSIAKFHQLAACAAFALEDIGLDEECIKPWKKAKSIAIRKNILFNNEREQIYSYMEDNGIYYVSLKGIIMQTLYPKFGMREMGDNDILYDSHYQDKMYDFMISRGYCAKIYKRYHHDEYIKSPIYNFEFHNLLFSRSKNEKFFEYYSNIIDKLQKVKDKNFEFCFSDEDFYIYNIAHSYQHYKTGGIGLRILTDCYVYILAKAKTLDFAYIETECEKLEIADYEKICRNLSQKIFSPKFEENNFTEMEKIQLNRIINSGAYGSYSLAIESRVNKLVENIEYVKYKKARYYFKRIFMPIETIKDEYPFFYRHKILIPCLLIYRVFRALTINRERLKAELISVDYTISKLKK